MNAVFGGAEIHRARTERIFLAAFHMRGQEMALLGLAGNHGLWRRPVGPFCLAGDLVLAGPFEARLADADAVTPRLAVLADQVKEAVVRIDDDRAGLLLAVIGNLLGQEHRVKLRGRRRCAF